MLTAEGAAFMLGCLFAPLTGWTIQVTDGMERESAPVTEMFIEPILNGAIAHLRARFPGDALAFAWTSSELISPDGVVVDTCADETAGRRPTGLEWMVVDFAVTLTATEFRAGFG